MSTSKPSPRAASNVSRRGRSSGSAGPRSFGATENSGPRGERIAPAPRGRSFRGLSPAERVQQRRQQLLAAGLELFGSRGFHSSGVRDICAAAKLTERYFYESFKNREALFEAVFQEAAEFQRQAVVDALTRAPAEPTLLARAALRALLDNYRSDPRLARILLIEVLSVGLGDASRAVSQSFALLIAQTVAALNPPSDQDTYNVKHVADGLYGSTVYIVMRWAEGGFVEPLEEILEHCVLFYEALFQLGQR